MVLATASAERARGKRARLSRMRLVAGGLLVVMAALLAGAAAFRGRYPALAWAQAFAEAGLVGGLADWFAVVALFRHPLGLPFPHTAIVPRNKDRIGQALGEFVERNFLTPETVAPRLLRLDPALRAARWLGRPANGAAAATLLAGAVPRLMEAIDDAEIEGLIGRSLGGWLERTDLSAIAGRLLKLLVAEGKHQLLLDQVLSGLGSWLDRNRETLRDRFGARSRLTPKWVDGYVVNRFIDSVIELVGEIVAAPRHEIRTSFDRFADGFITRLDSDPELRGRVEALKHEVLHNPQLAGIVAALWREIKRRLATDTPEEPSVIAGPLARSLVQMAQALRQDRAMMDRLSRAGIRLVEPALPWIGRQFTQLVAGVVRSWEASAVAHNIETEVGPDLQFIRLNGTLVGGLAGLLLHAALLLAGLVP
jgi:uncharacterized membrane-anchored protein YjiN (DUF445 family)